eukprot:m.336688 g.336688  ORF g.336688 m.336688 type:complete len:308 (-) comp16529_c0_seq154:4790-5713(-)
MTPHTLEEGGSGAQIATPAQMAHDSVATAPLSEEPLHSFVPRTEGGPDPIRSEERSPGSPALATSDLELRVAEELKLRMEVYDGLTVLSGLLVSSALFIFVQSRVSAPTAHFPGVAIVNMLLTSACLAANVYGTAIILLQKHKAGVRISLKQYRGAIQGWHRVWPQRENAVMSVTYSLPGILCASAFFMIGGEQVEPGNWAAFAVLLASAAHVFYAVVNMESEFSRAAIADKDIRGLMAWSRDRTSSQPRYFRWRQSEPAAERDKAERELVDRLGYGTLTKRPSSRPVKSNSKDSKKSGKPRPTTQV